MSEKDEIKITKDDLETFLRSVPHPVLLGIFGKYCEPCEDMQSELARRQLPDGVVFAKVTLTNDRDDVEIADMLGVDSVPTVIGFCRGQEVRRTSRLEELDKLINDITSCGDSTK